MKDLIVNGIIKKMAHQIEMSTAEAPAVNVLTSKCKFFWEINSSQDNIHIWNCSTKQ